jgi:phage terminase large subunit
MPKQIEITATNVFKRTWDAVACPECNHVLKHKKDCKRSGEPCSSYRIIVNVGGGRSSKTFSELQLLLLAATQGNKFEIDVVRETFPALRVTAMKDFYSILESLGLYSEKNENKTAHTYKFRGSEFSFYSIDEGQKVRGRQRDILFMNEANEISKDVFRQLEMRTTGLIFMDYNPSFNDGYIIEDILKRKDTFVIHSTFKDNPFAPEAEVKTIQSYEFDDPEYWKIYGLGEYGQRTGLIYNRIHQCEEFPPDAEDVGYGVDFGFSPDPKVVLKIGRIGRMLFLDELIYESELMREEMVKRFKILIDTNGQLIADSEDPESIEFIRRAGYNIKGVEKTKDSIEYGIDTVRGYDIYITQQSVNVWRDFSNYKYKMDRNGQPISPAVPAHSFSHSPDAARYYVFTKYGRVPQGMRAGDSVRSKISRSVSVSTFEGM